MVSKFVAIDLDGKNAFPYLGVMKNIFPALLLTVLLLGCSRIEPIEGSEKDYPQAPVEGFSVNAKLIKVLKEDVLLFDYLTQEETEKDLRALSDDARSIGAISLPWSADPKVHVFATGRQIAVYIGDTKEVIEVLLSEGGEQVVGDPLPKGVQVPVRSSSSSSTLSSDQR